MNKDEPPREMEDTEKQLEKVGRSRAIYKTVGCFVSIVFMVFVLWWLFTSGAFRWDKDYCCNAEKDANNVLVAMANYFSDLKRTKIPTITVLQAEEGFSTTNPFNNISITPVPSTVLSNSITIQVSVADASNRCPMGTTYTKTMGGGRGVWK